MERVASRNQDVVLRELEGSGIRLSMKREDELHPFISGNKFRKLKYNLIQAREAGALTLLSFGGAYSNHISALSYAAKKYGFRAVGIIRGDELGADIENTLRENPTLRFAFENGMRFKFISRGQYRDKEDQHFLEALKEEFGPFYLVPEGGTNAWAVKGCEEILAPGDAQYDVICVAVGTGGTIAGLINSAKEEQQVLGFPSLKGDFLAAEIKKYTIEKDNWSLINGYDFGGYAKINKNLISFINDFYQQTTIPLDPVYTGKMMFGIIDLIRQNYFKKNCNILAVHTGGLQGIKGMNDFLTKKNLPLINI
jgi:1-aminocyclopropane-1-carboxylate deaminase